MAGSVREGHILAPRSKRPRRIAVALAAIMIAVPTLVAADAYSAVTYRGSVNVSGYGTTRVCLKAGVGDWTGGTVFNMGMTYAYDGSGGLCDGPRQLPSGWIGVTVDAYKNGGFCGTSYYHYSSSPTSGYGHYFYGLCSNPSGTQEFYTVAWGKVYTGDHYYQPNGIVSPSQNY